MNQMNDKEISNIVKIKQASKYIKVGYPIFAVEFRQSLSKWHCGAKSLFIYLNQWKCFYGLIMGEVFQLVLSKKKKILRSRERGTKGRNILASIFAGSKLSVKKFRDRRSSFLYDFKV